MELNDIRKEIDRIDEQILKLFHQRMRLTEDVAAYKTANNMPVYQKDREDAVLKKAVNNSPQDLASASKLLFMTLMDISKCGQQEKITSESAAAAFRKEYAKKSSALKNKDRITAVCPGVRGSYSETACKKFFESKNAEIKLLPEFKDVFKAVESGAADYGVVPIENSTAGDVTATYDLLLKYSLYITSALSIPVNHVLAVKKGVSVSDIRTVFSHEQAIHQCSLFLAANPQMMPVPYENTATAAKMVSEHPSNEMAAICSSGCAELYGLSIAVENIADNKDNFTRFICISKTPEPDENAGIISLSLSLPHTPGALYRLLTRFAYCGVNLLKIQSKPIPPQWSGIKQDNFDVIFYLDFSGSLNNPPTVKLLLNLQKELKFFRILGNYSNIE